jgi:hypothetical protein
MGAMGNLKIFPFAESLRRRLSMGMQDHPSYSESQGFTPLCSWGDCNEDAHIGLMVEFRGKVGLDMCATHAVMALEELGHV